MTKKNMRKHHGANVDKLIERMQNPPRINFALRTDRSDDGVVSVVKAAPVSVEVEEVNYRPDAEYRRVTDALLRANNIFEERITKEYGGLWWSTSLIEAMNVNPLLKMDGVSVYGRRMDAMTFRFGGEPDLRAVEIYDALIVVGSRGCVFRVKSGDARRLQIREDGLVCTYSVEPAREISNLVYPRIRDEYMRRVEDSTGLKLLPDQRQPEITYTVGDILTHPIMMIPAGFLIAGGIGIAMGIYMMFNG